METEVKIKKVAPNQNRDTGDGNNKISIPGQELATNIMVAHEARREETGAFRNKHVAMKQKRRRLS